MALPEHHEFRRMAATVEADEEGTTYERYPRAEARAIYAGGICFFRPPARVGVEFLRPRSATEAATNQRKS